MKNTITAILLFLTIVVHSQELPKPAQGKSMVLFCRVDAMGFLINFKYFDGEKYLGKFNHGKYLAYECEPGKHLFWAKSENVSFLEADLLADKIYIVDSEPQMGAFKAGVRLVPFNNDITTYKNEKKYIRVKNRVIASVKEGKSYSIIDEDKQAEESDLQEMITRIMKKYKDFKLINEEITQLPATMFVSE